MHPVKKELYKLCESWAKKCLHEAEQAIASAQEAAADDTKSSAGDKYETTREMMQQEIARGQVQLLEAGKTLHALSRIKPDTVSDHIQPGSLAITSRGSFYISIGAGKLEVEGTVYYALSPVSPLGRKLAGLKAGDTFLFNGNKFEVQQVV